MQPLGIGRTAEIFPYTAGKVLKLFFSWCPRQWVETEFEFTKKARELGLPAPQVFGVAEMDGRHGIVMERIDGVSMLTALRRKPFQLDNYARQLVQLQRLMHGKRQQGGSYLRVGLERKIKTIDLLNDAQKSAVIKLLGNLPDGDSVCHMDFHPDNILLTANGPVIIDWSNLCPGAPAADVARSWLIMLAGEPPAGTPGLWLINLIRKRFIRKYLKYYLADSPLIRDEVRKWLIPMAAARMAEEIPGEQGILLRTILDFIAK